MKCLMGVLLLLVGSDTLARAAEFRSVKFAAEIRLVNCPAGFSELRQCKGTREDLGIQKLELTRNAAGFQIGEMSFSRSAPVPVYFKIYAVLAELGDVAPDEYTLGLKAGFHADAKRNPFNETSFDINRLPQYLTVYSGFQKFGDREIAVALDLNQIEVSRRK